MEDHLSTEVDLSDHVRRRTASPRLFRWPLDDLIEACRRKNVEYEEADDFLAIEGLVTKCGESILISVRASLEDAEKRFTLSHELAHLALSHQDKGKQAGFHFELRGDELVIQQNAAKELEADIWAAHLLVDPEVCGEYLKEWQYYSQASNDTIDYAIAILSMELGIPSRGVRIWLEHRNHRFNVHPTAWLVTP